MIITATPEPSHFPPRVRLDIDGQGADLLELTVMRDGRPIRQQPAVAGLTETFAYDYEAPFGVPVTYTATGTTAGGWATVRAENWSSLTDWSTVSGTPQVTDGRFRGASSGLGVPAARVSRGLSDVAGSAVRLTLAARDVLATGPTDGASGRASVTIGGVGFEARGRGSTFGVLTGSDFSPFAAAASGPIQMTFAPHRATVTITHGSTTTERSVTPGPDALFVDVYGFSSSVGGFLVEVAAGVPTSATATTTLEAVAAWLIHPIRPSLSVPIEHFGSDGEISVEASTDNQRTYAARQAIYQPNGRRESVMFPLGPRAAGSWTLVLNTHTLDARNDLLNLLDDQAPVLLRSPGAANWDLPDGWYAVGDVAPERPVDIGSHQWRKIALPLTRTAEPPVTLAPQLTWGDLKLRGVTWGDLLGKNWLMMLMGESG